MSPSSTPCDDLGGMDSGKGRLSHNDVHYLVGFLYSIVNRNQGSVVLGERIEDIASESNRDVDIVVVSNEDGAIAGVEVKDEKDPLDVIDVEALACKLGDMPALRERAIVSASGYTKPAVRKARAHGVVCLRLARGPLPAGLGGTDLSALDHIDQRGFCEGPRVTATEFVVGSRVPADAAILEEREFIDRIAQAYARDWEEDGAQLEKTIRLPVTVLMRNQQGRAVAVRAVHVAGVVGTRRLPLVAECFVEDLEGQPFAGAKLYEQDGDLWGIGIPRGSFHPFIRKIPNVDRQRRPLRFRM